MGQLQLKDIHVPAPMRDLRAFLVYKLEKFPDEPKPRKIPYYSDGGRRKGHQGSAVDRASLTTFTAARDAAAKRGFDGVGFAPLPEFGITALDFDNCFADDGSLLDGVEDAIAGGYAELSPSGKGVRAFVRGNLGNHKSKSAPGQFGFETFATSGFVTVTGNMLPHIDLLGLENTIPTVNAAVAQLCRQRFGEDRKPPDAIDSDDPFAGLEKPLGLTIEKMEALLADIDPDVSREEWIRVGMALHHECEGDDTGFEVWHDWSEKGAKYPSREALEEQWRSFDRELPRGRRRVTMASVIRMAKQASQGTGQAQAATGEEAKAKAAETPAGDPKGAVATGSDFTGKYPILSAQAMAHRPPGEWLIKGVVPQADVVVLFGASGSGKSFVALDMAAAISRGVDWRDRKTKKGRVLIIAAEGGGGVGKRIKAYAQHHNLKVEDLDIGVIVASPNFLQKEEIFEVVSAIRNSGGVDLIIADTFAQVTPGANENAGEDMGLAMANAKALREATGAVVMLIHHAGKDITRGARGWSGIKAAADAEIEIIKYDTGGREIRISKMKDGDDGLQWGFKLDIVKLGVDKDGDDITSCVTVDAEVPLPPSDDERKNVKQYTEAEAHILRVIEEVLDPQITNIHLDAFTQLCVDELPVPEEGKRDGRKNRVANAIQSLAKDKKHQRFKLEHGYVVIM